MLLCRPELRDAPYYVVRHNAQRTRKNIFWKYRINF